MAKQITDLAALTTADSTDVLLIRDVSAAVDKKTTVGGLATAVASSLPNASVTNAKLATGATRLGIAKKNTTSTLVSDAYTTYLTVTATSTGRECEAYFSIVVNNANSGGNRFVQAKVQCDGVDIAPVDMDIYLQAISSNTPRYNLSFVVSSTPTAASHTWTLQLRASNASAVALDWAVLRVQEIA